MKKIYITEKQLVEFMKLDEAIQQYVNKKPGQTIDAAIKDAARDSAREAPNAEIDFVISKDEVNEDINNSINVVDEVANYIIKNWGDEFENGGLTDSGLKDMIQDAYIEVTDEEIDYDNNELYNKIINKIKKCLNNNCENKQTNESVTITKKQIKEAITKKRIAESKVYTKKDLKKMCK